MPLRLKVVLFFALLLLGPKANATIWTVNNMPNSAAQFETIQAAIDNAFSGDTIQIHGSEQRYAQVLINKRLVLIGPGHNINGSNPQNGLSRSYASIEGIRFSADGNGSRSVLEGLVIAVIVTEKTNRVTISRCHVSFGITAERLPSEDWAVKNSVILNISGNVSSSSPTAPGWTIRNNIIYGQVGGLTLARILNNTFLGGGGPVRVYNSAVENNIFLAITQNGSQNSSFANNLTFHGGLEDIVTETNSGSNNFNQVDPEFVNAPGYRLPEGYGGFNYNHNYRLQEDSPGKNAGTDGTDIGAYGGDGHSDTGTPPMPVVTRFALKNSVLKPGGTLRIFVSGEAQND